MLLVPNDALAEVQIVLFQEWRVDSEVGITAPPGQARGRRASSKNCSGSKSVDDESTAGKNLGGKVGGEVGRSASPPLATPAAAAVGTLADGTVAGWGYNFYGQTDGPGGTFTAIAAGDFHSLGIRSDGTLAGWGNNDYGQTNVPGGTFTAVAAGAAHGLGIRSDGTLAGWGNNGNG